MGCTGTSIEKTGPRRQQRSRANRNQLVARSNNSSKPFNNCFFIGGIGFLSSGTGLTATLHHLLHVPRKQDERFSGYLARQRIDLRQGQADRGLQ
jgi:hypothetical protein